VGRIMFCRRRGLRIGRKENGALMGNDDMYFTACGNNCIFGKSSCA
jgi:hypothetical protein